MKQYDPSSLLPRCRVPILFVNGTNDTHYPLDSYMKSFQVVPGFKQLRIVVNMPHSHPAGWAPEEIGLFIDSKCREGLPLPVPGIPRSAEGQIRVNCDTQTELKSAQLHYTVDTGLRSKRTWQSVPAVINGATVIVDESPAEANAWFLTICDEREAIVSTTVQFRP